MRTRAHIHSLTLTILHTPKHSFVHINRTCTHMYYPPCCAAPCTQGTNSEADSEPADEKSVNLDTTDWARGRRLKKLHALLHTRQARIDFMHYKEQMVWVLVMQLGVHLALFIVSVEEGSEGVAGLQGWVWAALSRCSIPLHGLVEFQQKLG